MAANKIVPSQTALLLLDLQVMYSKTDTRFEALATHTAPIVKAARSQGITIVHCRLAFTESEAVSIPDTNGTFSKLKQDPSRRVAFSVDSPEAAFHAAVTPEDGDIVVRKHRVGPFLNAPQDVHAIFKRRGIDTLLLGGISTGGAVAATVAQAADLDYRLFVMEDACADRDQETHDFFIKFFAKRGTVINSKELKNFIER